MHGLSIVLGLLFSTAALADWRQESRATLHQHSEACDASEVKIDSIVKNQYIKGHVTGLPAEALDDFKMVFYIKTNIWYVHPYQYYPDQEEGYSYSNLNAKGEFQVKTVRRDVPARYLAAVLVPKSFKIRHRRWWLRPLLGFVGGVLKFQCNHTIVKGNGDF